MELKIKIEELYKNFINTRPFPCIGAKASLARNQAVCLVVGDMGCPSQDREILNFLYDFTDDFRATGGGFHSAAIIFTGPENITETGFEKLIWIRLQALLDMDAQQYHYDQRVSPDPASPDFSFSIKEEAFFIIGMHPTSSRPARRFPYPALVFNPHVQFDTLKAARKFNAMQSAIRKKDMSFSGSVNPMLSDYGQSPELNQYSGKNYSTPPQCPLTINHAKK